MSAINLKASAVAERWSGHGEGGTLWYLRINGVPRGNIYESTPADIAMVKATASWLQRAIDAHLKVEPLP